MIFYNDICYEPLPPAGEPGGERVHAGLPGHVLVGGQLGQGPPGGWLVVVHTVSPRAGH